MDRAHTGSSMLDSALSGGIPVGTAVLLSGDEGAGATEFALNLLRTVAKEKRAARFASALRSPARVANEANELFEDDAAASLLDLKLLDAKGIRAGPEGVMHGLRPGDVLVLESADTLAPAGEAEDLRREWRILADAAAERGVTVLLLHAPGTLPAPVEASLAETADGVFRFRWHDGGPTRRRTLQLVKMRGLSNALDGDQVPIFEVALHKGVGFEVSRGKSVL